MLVFAFIAGYASFLLSVMVKRETIVFSTNSVIRDLTTDFGDHKLAQSGFAFAVGLRYADGTLLDPDFITKYKVSVSQYEAEAVGGGFFTEKYTNLDLHICGDTFPYHNQTVVKHFGIDK